MSQTYLQDPSEVLVYSHDFTDVLNGTAISGSPTWSVEGGDAITLDQASLSGAIASARATVAANRWGHVVDLVCRVTNNASPAETFERRWTVRIGSH